MQRSPLAGTWSLKTWHKEADDGARSRPLGPDATGYVSHPEDGVVFVHFMAARRAQYRTNDPVGGSAEEESTAMTSRITNAGRYEDRGEQVVHHATHAACPKRVATQGCGRSRSPKTVCASAHPGRFSTVGA